MNQAERIRDIVSDILKRDDLGTSERELKDKIELNGKSVYGIKYSRLKDYLLNRKEYNFSEGAVTGALQTLAERVDNIYKQKTKKGVFFVYFDDKEITENKQIKVIITESEDYNDLVEQVRSVSDQVSKILKNASKGKYKKTYDTDLKHLRNLLKISSDLEITLKNYKNEKTFEKIENQFNDLPF